MTGPSTFFIFNLFLLLLLLLLLLFVTNHNTLTICFAKVKSHESQLTSFKVRLKQLIIF